MTPADILAVVNVKLKDESITEAGRVYAIEEIEQVIQSYCHIDEVPAALKYTWANMAVDLLRYEHAANTPADADEAQTAGAVSSIREGDTTVSFGGKSSEADDRDRALNSHHAKLDSLVLGYKKQLQEFRKVRR